MRSFNLFELKFFAIYSSKNWDNYDTIIILYKYSISMAHLPQYTVHFIRYILHKIKKFRIL